MNIVVVNPSASALSVLSDFGAAQVHIVVWDDASPTAPELDGPRTIRVTRPQRKATMQRLLDALERSVVGRNILRLTPLDPGRTFARHSARLPNLAAELHHADIVVAAERDAVLTVWRLGRRLAPKESHLVYGVAAAQTLLTTVNAS